MGSVPLVSLSTCLCACGLWLVRLRLLSGVFQGEGEFKLIPGADGDRADGGSKEGGGGHPRHTVGGAGAR